jgi:signal transduction histidine kinase
MALPQRIDERVRSTPEERSRAELALELARGWAWEYDVSTRELYRSHDISTLFGKPVGALSPTLEAYQEHIHPDDREKVKRAFRDAINNRTGYDIEFRVVWPDGTVHWMAGRGRTLLDRNGNPCKVIGVDMDVTERKLLQEVVVDRERLVALGRISATLAHELNNPLTAVQNAVHLLGESGRLSERQMKILGIAEKEIQRSVEIIRSTLGIQREASAPVAVDLARLVEEVLTLFEARLQRQMIHVKKSYREAPTLLVLPGQIRQVLVNVIGNAVDAMPDGGVLAIRIASSKMNNGRGVRLLVCDSGPGIDREMQARVFELFFTTKGHSGSGIGLWVSKQIVEM